MKHLYITNIKIVIDILLTVSYIMNATKQKQLTNERKRQYGKQGTLWITD